MVPYGPLWIYMVLYGPLWPPMDLYGSIWFHVVPPYWLQILGIKFFFTIQVNPILVQFLHLYNSCIFRGACTFESASQSVRGEYFTKTKETFPKGYKQTLPQK